MFKRSLIKAPFYSSVGIWKKGGSAWVSMFPHGSIILSLSFSLSFFFPFFFFPSLFFPTILLIFSCLLRVQCIWTLFLALTEMGMRNDVGVSRVWRWSSQLPGLCTEKKAAITVNNAALCGLADETRRLLITAAPWCLVISTCCCGHKPFLWW